MERLEGCRRVRAPEGWRVGIGGVYRLEIDETKWVDRQALAKAFGRDWRLHRIELAITGEVEKTADGLVFTARGSAARIALANRDKREDETAAPDVVGRIERFRDDGKRTLRVSGAVEWDKEGRAKLYLEAAEPAEK